MKLITQAKHILNDWFLMEFLNQSSYEDETDCKRIRLLLKKLKIGDAAQATQGIEKNVTLLSFRLDENMEYVHGSLKRSPLLWTLKRIAGKQMI